MDVAQLEQADHSSYEDVPYRSVAYTITHPARMGAIAALMGLRPAPPASARVLELGCADGWNLMSIGAFLPGARLLGIDRSPSHIAAGERARRALGLGNVELRVGDITALEGLGTFDYIIAHGVYSWIPGHVQRALLGLYRAHLAPQGVGYISYNCHPGWHERQAIRDMMLFHTRGMADGRDKARAATELIDLLVEVVPKDSLYWRPLAKESHILHTATIDYVVHEHLSAFNQPVLFHAFAEAAQAAGLRYLGDASFEANFGYEQPEDLYRELERLAGGDRIALEQYLDLLLDRGFRTTLVCQQEVTPLAIPSQERLRELYAQAQCTPDSPDPETGKPRWKVAGRSITPPSDTANALVRVLVDAWPRALRVGELFDAVRRAAPSPVDSLTAWRFFSVEVMACRAARCLELLTHPFAFGDGDPRPTAAPIARYQHAQGFPRLIGSDHRSIQLEPPLQRLLELCDGTRDHAALVDAMVAAVDRGELVLELDTPATPQQLRQGLELALGRGLERLQRAGMLA